MKTKMRERERERVIEGLQCPECGAWLINSSPKHAVCPAGHGRLMPKITRKRYGELLPAAMRLKNRRGCRVCFEIEGREGVFVIAGKFNPAAGGIVSSKSVPAKYRTAGGTLVVKSFISFSSQ